MEPEAAHLHASSAAGLMPPPDLSQPTTPQPTHAALPENSLSPSHSSAMDKAKYTSPAPPRTSSMTPPPSSQLPALLPAPARAEARTPSSPTPQLESPPPTERQTVQLEPVVEPNGVLFTNEQVSAASPDELRAMVNDLAAALRSASMSSAHYRLQYNMACLESEEAQKRMQVELEMAQREVEVLQEAEERRRSSNPLPLQPLQDAAINAQNALMINELTRQCQLLQNENDSLTEDLVKAHRTLEHREGEIRTLLEENRTLRERIKKNREHFNHVMHNAGADQSPPYSAFGTPATPRNPTGRRSTVSDAARSQQPFEALLLADKMLSQKTPTAPSTPTRPTPTKSKFSHTRGTHSMSSLPSTPNRSRPVQSTMFNTPPTFNAINHVPMSASTAHYTPKRVRRESSDSTITASSVDENERYSEKDEVPESQAASAASSMLRRTPHTSFDGGALRKPGGSVQSKLFGHVRKSGVSRPPEQDKKRVGSHSAASMQGSPAKKGRVGEGVGLGIGLTSGRA